MEIGSLPTLVSPRPATTRSGVGGVRASSAQTNNGPVLQGELLRRERQQGEQLNAKVDVIKARRRDDHPAFQRRHDNPNYTQRLAMQAYQAHTSIAQQGNARGRVDYFA